MGLTQRYTAGMSTRRWMDLPERLLPVWALTPTQAIVGDLWPTRLPHPRACADPCIHVVQVGRVLYVEDGHHRLARARRDGAHLIRSRLLMAQVSSPSTNDVPQSQGTT